jgi:hypothetical protein
MNNDKIYRKLTINMQNKIAKFKEGRSTKDRLNDQLVLNISSLCRFLRKKEEQKNKEEEEREERRKKKNELIIEQKKIIAQMLKQEAIDKKKKDTKKTLKTNKLSEEMKKLKKEKMEIEAKIAKIDQDEVESQNHTILDVFVPYSRLTKSLQMKLESLNEEIPEEEAEDNDLLFDGELMDTGMNNNNNLEHNKIENLIADEDADDQNFEANLNANTNYLDNDDISISMSLYQKPVGFDDFKTINENNNIKNQKEEKENDKGKDKENVKAKKAMEQIPEVKKDDQLKKAYEDFKDILKPKEIKEAVNEMCYDYIKYMYALFQKMIKKSKEYVFESQNKTLNFVNQFKSFILDIGISDKKFYEQCIREIIYNNSELKFVEFLECFKKLINLKFDQIFLKYKFLLNIVERQDDEYFTEEELEKYYSLIFNCRKSNENEIQEEIRYKLVNKYKKIFPKSEKFSTRKLSLILEQFFDIK